MGQYYNVTLKLERMDKIIELIDKHRELATQLEKNAEELFGNIGRLEIELNEAVDGHQQPHNAGTTA